MIRLFSKRCTKLLSSTRTIPWTKVSSNDELGKQSPLKLPVLFMCNNCDDENKKDTIAYVIKRWQKRFLQEGIPEPIESIEHIVSHVIGLKKRTDLINHHKKVLNKEQLEKLELLCERRLARVPVQYIVGKWDFRDITLFVEPPVFVPRKETEKVVDVIVSRISDCGNKENNILEIGCGSGAISLSVLHATKNTNVVAIDVNPRACELTIKNAKNLNLDTRITVVNAALKKDGEIDVKKSDYVGKMNKEVDFRKIKLDFIISNPPFTPVKEIHGLLKLYEDINALDGGDDGLMWMKPIFDYGSKTVNTGGYLILELFPGQVEGIKSIVEKHYVNKLKFKHAYEDYIVEIQKIK